MKAIIYSNGNQECQRAAALMDAVHMDDTIIYRLGKDFTEAQFRTEFGEEASYPMICLLYTSPSPRDQRGSRMPSSA